MRAGIEVDLREWKRAANELLKSSSRTLVDFTNGQAFAVINRALKMTEKADRKKIERMMSSNPAQDELRGGRAGQRGWVRVLRTRDVDKWRNTVAARMVAAYRRDHGHWPVNPTTGDDLGDYARRLVAVKVKSVGMMRAGWINAMNQLRRVVYKVPPGVKNDQGFGKRARHGYAIPAKFTLFSVIQAIAVNEAPDYQRKMRQEKAWLGILGNPTSIIVTGLRAAIQASTADMKQHLLRVMKREANKVKPR